MSKCNQMLDKTRSPRYQAQAQTGVSSTNLFEVGVVRAPDLSVTDSPFTGFRGL